MDCENDPFNPVFEAKASHSIGILKLWQSVLVEEKPNALFEFSDEGIRVVVEKNKVIQGSVFVKKDCFDDYKFKHPSGNVKLVIDLRYLLKCMGVLTNVTEGDDDSSYGERSFRPSLGSDIKPWTMRLENTDSPLLLLLDDDSESDNQIRCTVATLANTNLIIFPPIGEKDTVARMTIKSELLLELWGDLDHSSEKLWITMGNGEICGSFVTKSEIAEVELSLAKKNLLHFKYEKKEDTTLCFRMALFKMTVRSMMLSQKANLSFTNDGRLVMELSIVEEAATGEHSQWAEYILTSLSEEQEEEFRIASHFRR